VLAEHFVKQLDERNGWKPKKLGASALETLESYPWPGNVRELRNVVERVLLLAPGDVVEADTVARALPQSGGLAADASHVGVMNNSAMANGPLATRVEAFEKETLLAVLKQYHNHMTNTAKALGLERSHLYKKCQQLGIDVQTLRQSE